MVQKNNKKKHKKSANAILSVLAPSTNINAAERFYELLILLLSLSPHKNANHQTFLILLSQFLEKIFYDKSN